MERRVPGRPARPILLSLVALSLIAPVAGAQSVPTVTLSEPAATFAEPFDQVTSIRELRDGRVLVADLFGRSVTVADFRANTATRVGREGQGPLEYAFPQALIALPGDTTFLVDPAQGRFLVIGPDATPLGTERFPDGTGGMFRARGADAQGRIYAQGSPFSPDRPLDMEGGTLPDSVPLLLWDRARNRVDQLGKIKIPSMNVGVSGSAGNRNVSISSQPFAPADDWAVAPDGSVGIVRVGDYHVDWWGTPRAQGRPVRFTPSPVGDADREAFQSRFRDPRGALRLERTSGGPPPSGARASAPPAPSVPEPEWPEVKPPFVSGTAIASPSGLWVERSQPADAAPLYDVFDRQGTLVRQVRLAPRSRVVGVTRSWLYVARTGDDDLQYLERYRVPN